MSFQAIDGGSLNDTKFVMAMNVLGANTKPQ
jgi:hypothetical protein